MAALTYQAVRVGNGSAAHTVTASTDDGIGLAVAAVVIDDTKTKPEIMEALRAIMRRINRDGVKSNLPSEYPVSGSTVE